MKKLILFLVTALFATTSMFAQTPDDPPTCTGSAAAPAVGVLYTYEVSIENTGGYTGNGTFDWYVMDQGQLNLLTGGHIPAVNTEFVASGWYDTPTPSANTIDITWTSEALATAEPYFLVVVYEESAVCTPTNNMKVYRIAPQNTFWLAMDNITTVQCAAAVSSAVLNDTGDPGEVEYLYGSNTLQVLVTASGYTGLWDAQLQLGGFQLDQTVNAAGITWSAASGATGTFTGPADLNGIWTSPTQLPSLVDGDEITITIVFDNNHFETLADQTLAIAIDGSYTSGTTTFHDLSDVNGDCTPESAFADAEQQTISARSTITPVNPATFVPQVNP
jgi:hypothetical protein